MMLSRETGGFWALPRQKETSRFKAPQGTVLPDGQLMCAIYRLQVHGLSPVKLSAALVRSRQVRFLHDYD